MRHTKRWTGAGVMGLTLVAGLVAAAVLMGPAGRALGVPSLDDLLGQAMESHPAILLAKAKVAQAEAELGTVEMEVTRQMIALRGEFDTLEQAAGAARQQLEAARVGWEKVKTGDLKDVVEGEKKVSEAKAAVAEAEAKVARLNAELERMQGVLGRLAERAARGRAEPPPPEGEPQVPSGRAIETIVAALDKPLDLDFSDAGIADVVKKLREVSKCPFTLDPRQDWGDAKVTVQLKGTKLIGVLQAIEDQCSGLVFVVREYGILATQKERARGHGFLPAVRLWQDKAGEKGEEKPEAPAPEEAPKPPAPPKQG